MGADLDLADNEGIPPILKAWNNPEHIATLIQHGCNVDVNTKHGFSILELAAMQANFDLVSSLLSAGAKPPSHSALNEPRTKHQVEYHALSELCSVPLTLKDQCRLRIRKLIRGHQLLNTGISMLPLPALIKNYLMMTELSTLTAACTFGSSEYQCQPRAS